MVAADWSDFRPLGQVVHKHHGILVANMRPRELNSINSNPIKWSIDRDRRQRSMHSSSKRVRIADQTPASPSSDVSPPPIMASELTVDFYIAQVSTNYSITEESFPLARWSLGGITLSVLPLCRGRHFKNILRAGQHQSPRLSFVLR